jgi:non-specific protein-tyrosine kinase
MELKEYLQVFRKWWWLILLSTFVAGAASFTVSSLMPSVYEAHVTLMSNESANTGIVDYASLLGSQQIIETYRELLQTEPVLATVIDSLDLPYSSRELRKHIEVSVIPDTQLLKLKVEDRDPQRAAGIANEIALTFLEQRSSGRPVAELEDYERSLVEQMQNLERAIRETEADLEDLPSASSSSDGTEDLADLQVQLSQQRSAYADLLSGYLNIRSMKSRLLGVVVVDPAQPPIEPVRPRKLLNTAIALVGGATLACILAFAIEYFSDVLESPEDISETLSLPHLGTIPFVERWQKNGYTLSKQDEWPVTEAFRILRTNIQFSNIDNAINTLLLTSPGASEGKTSLVARLGAVIAQNDRRVLLVDTDLRRPRLHKLFSISRGVGLTSLLMDELDIEDCVVETNTANLYVLPGGPTPPNPAEMLGSHRMAEFIEEAQAFADVIIFDVPPVLACADAMVLAPQMNGVLLVVDSGSTGRGDALRASEMLRTVDAKILGVVLNKSRDRSSEYRHYYSSEEAVEGSFWTRWFPWSA